MNRITHQRHATSLRSCARGEGPRKGGAVIVVVLALMAMLVFLGLFFYDFVQVEANTSENFSQTQGELAGIDPESLIAEAMSQVISHAEDSAVARGSVFVGGKHGLLAHELGTVKKDTSVTPNVYRPTDYEIRNGRGIRVIPGSPPQFAYMGTDSSPNPTAGGTTPTAVDSTQFILNRGAGANDGTALADTDAPQYEPDVGYTYPDLNAHFLAYEYLQKEDLNENGSPDAGEDLNADGDVNDFVRIIKPSFMDPALFKQLQTNTEDWYNNASSRKWMLRPHRSHRIVGGTAAEMRFSATDFPKLDNSALAIGPWTNSGNDYTGLDVDADNDGIPDSIYLDQGLPPVKLPGNRTLIPMTFWKIEDLSGLVDLNAAGNMAEFFRQNAAGNVDLQSLIYNSNRPVHYSNYGLSRAEVNPMWALFANPVGSGLTIFPWDVAFYRTDPTTAAFGDDPMPAPPGRGRLRMQNTELAMMLIGSPTTMGQSINSSFDYTTQLDDLQGRYGDAASIPSTYNNAQFSAPGTRNTDDDSEDTNGNGLLDMGEDVNSNGRLDGPVVSRGVHPSDPAGTGGIPISIGNPQIPNGSRLLAQVNATANPLSTYFPRYNGYWQSQFVQTGTYQDPDPTLYLLGPTGLMEYPYDYRRDNASEVNRYSFSRSERDNPFRPYEIAALHLSDYDYARSSMFSRVRQLAPFNFNMHVSSRDIRRQFTTETWARREFSFPYEPQRPFEFNDVDGIDGNMFRFPPKFNGVAASRHEPIAEDANRNGNLDTGEDGNGNNLLDPGVISAEDPFRPEIRRLLTTRSFQPTLPLSPNTFGPLRNRVYFPQLPIELNRLLDDHPSATAADHYPAFDSLGNPNFRELTPHPSFRGLGAPVPALDDMVHSNDVSSYTSPHPVTQFLNRGSTQALQEWWARYDRQRMARDIYVLLATLCGPTATPSTTTALDPVVAKEMAQFAVNYVDALDTDDVITRFEYDPDLSDGWNITPSYYSSNEYYVNGVEAQKLSFGEVLWVKHDRHSSNINATFHKDDTGYHQFLYIELRNCTPFRLDLHDETWRIARLNATGLTPTTDPRVAASHLASFSFRSTTRYVEPGANFVIASHDGNAVDAGGVPILSDYYADTNGDMTLEAVVPADGGAAPTGPPYDTSLCDLDLCNTTPYHTDAYTLDQPITIGTTSNTNPKLLYFDDDTADTDADNANRMVLSLQRRRHLYTDGNLPQVDTDWIEVDRFDFTINSGNAFTIAAEADVATKFPEIQSLERYHPLDDRTRLAIDNPPTPRPNLAHHSIYQAYSPTNTSNPTRRNTIANSTENPGEDMSYAYQTVWQPHHDRDFTSVYELVSVPLFAPDQLLARLRDHAKTPPNNVSGVNGWANSTVGILTPSLASVRFSPRVTGVSPEPVPWSRLLNFVALPDPTDQTQRTVNSNFTRSRTYGQVNINMIRTPPVLAGLIDSDQFLPFGGTIQSNSDFLTDLIDGNRKWWTTFKEQRDGGPGTGMASLISRPFLPPGQYNPSVTGTDPPPSEYGMLRHQYPAASFPITSMTSPTIGLFDARPLNDAQDTNQFVDVHTRSRLLQKIANNSGTRSHMYAIWGGIDFFEGTETPASSGRFQVGKKATDVQTCRWFFVVDMSRLEEAYDSKTQSFDWRKFIVYRQRLE